jgi:periplasmic protein TonB
MKNQIMLVLCGLLMSQLLFAQATTVDTDTAIYNVVEKKPEYPRGESAMLKFIYKNLKYPAEAKAKKIEGTVYIKFVIEKDGSISNATIIRDLEGGCGEEALKVINMMPKWSPGRQRGKPKRVSFALPVKFKLG